jgi:hypothetical protein
MERTGCGHAFSTSASPRCLRAGLSRKSSRNRSGTLCHGAANGTSASSFNLQCRGEQYEAKSARAGRALNRATGARPDGARCNQRQTRACLPSEADPGVPAVLPPLKRRQQWISSDSLLLCAVQKANVRGCVSRERAQGRARSHKHHTACGAMQTLRPAKTSRAVDSSGPCPSSSFSFPRAPSFAQTSSKLARAILFFPYTIFFCFHVKPKIQNSARPLNKTSSGPLEATSRNSGLGVTPAQPHPTRAASHEKPHSKVQREIKR